MSHNVLNLPKEVLEKISYYFPKEKYKVYLVGGYLRDLLFRNIVSKDLDFAIKPLFRLKNDHFYIKDIYFKPPFWSVKLTINDKDIHLSFFRKEIFNHDFSMNYSLTNNIYDDVYRRDITLNSLYYEIYDNKFIDIFNIKNKNPKIEFISSNHFFTDPSRILRTFKYSKLLEIEINKSNYAILKKALKYFKKFSNKFSSSKFRFKKQLKNEINILSDKERLFFSSFL